MNLLRLIELLITILISFNICYSLSAVQSRNKWISADISTFQDLQSRLDSIDDKLRIRLDNIEDKLRDIYSIRFNIIKLEMGLARMESHLTTSQTSMQIKMRDIYEVLLKHDIQREQMIQKCEVSQSRLLHKINMLETRFDESFNKLQGNSVVTLGKIENKQNDMMNKVTDINSNIDFIKSSNYKLEEKINTTQKELIQHLKETQQQLAKQDHLDKIENKINGLHGQLNKTEVIWSAQNDSPKGSYLEQEQIMRDIKSELRSEAQKVGNKVNNMYNDIWKKISMLENSLKEIIIQINITQKDLQEDLRQIFNDQRDSEGYLDIIVDRILTVIQSKFTDLHRRNDNHFQSLALAQTVTTGTCQKIHEDESENWSRIALVLEKILDTFLNKTDKISKQSIDLLEALKGHNGQMIRTVSDAKNMVITLAEENSHDHKALDSSIHDVGKRADIIAAIVEELQEQLEDINGTMCFNGLIFSNTSQVTNNSQNNPSELKSKENQKNDNKTINAIEVNSSTGVIKIITEDILPEESLKDIKENITIINLKNNGSNKDNIDQIMYLNNNALSTSKITGIIRSLGINKTDDQANTETDKEINKINSDKINNENNKDKDLSIEDEDIETSFILSYINFIKGHMTKEEFLQEGFPGKSFKSIQEMITFMKPLNIIRNEFLRELDKYDREENESEITGRRHDFFDTTNFDYEDSSDEFMTP
ncbi:hypothetical protein O3M35_000985 [Rhynocoris fuscipes]|uniref:Uncharacterized protein n=1 Tax=Rhynocoris fuscipes TaxID=488301 RepID=A0AAW1DQA0_9HEMI